MGLSIRIGTGGIEVADRTQKGRNLFVFPDDFSVVDVETTGYSPAYNLIIELSALRVRGGEIVDSFSSIVSHGPGAIIDDYITSLTTITQADIDQAPHIKDVFPDFIKFVGDDLILGHNTIFDIRFLYDECMAQFGKPFKNDYFDTMRISRRLHPEYAHHRLADLCDRYGVDLAGAHRGLPDCQHTFACYNKLKSEIISIYGSTDSFVKAFKKSSRGVTASDITVEKEDFDISHPLYGKTCVFTGALEKMPRREAMQIVANCGGVNGNSVTKKTDFLILGNNDYCKSIKDGKSNKQKKAEKLILDGCDLMVLPESAFYDMITDYFE